MTIRLSTGLRNAMVDGTGFAGALTGGAIYIYTGHQPTHPDDAVQGTLLGIITKDHAAWEAGTPTNGLEFDAAADGTISKKTGDNWQMSTSESFGSTTGTAGSNADGTAGWFRFVSNSSDEDGNADLTGTLARMDGSVGVSGADLILPVIALKTTTPVTVDEFEYTLPES